MVPPPPVTPSPHRFVVKKPGRASQVPQAPQPPSVSRLQQFNSTPRFHLAASQRGSASDSPCREGTPLANPYSTLTRPKDIIEDFTDVLETDIHESNEPMEACSDPENLPVDEDADYDINRRISKRRRLSSPILDSPNHNLDEQDEGIYCNASGSHEQSDDILSSTNTVILSPPAVTLHRPPNPTNAPRFILPSTPAAVPPSVPAIAQTATFVKPPRFRPSDDQEPHQRPSEPLPDAFSPQRRGQKFLVGGLAAEVIGWVVNLDNSAPVTSSTWSKENTWLIQLVVDEARGGPGAGMTLISGRQVLSGLNEREGAIADSLGIKKFILAGSGDTGIFQGTNRVEAGKRIGIKSPVWEVIVEGEKWVVAATWQVMDEVACEG